MFSESTTKFVETDESGPTYSIHVDNNIVTPPSPGIPVNDDDDNDQASATVPDRPGSFELSPRKTAILLRWTDSDSDGGSAITDYQYQIKYSRTQNRTRWTSWSDWTSAGTGNSTWITGLYKNVHYAVRMRAVNSVGNSSVTGIKIVKTNK